RRRHTRSKRDWSSVVCSSDLAHGDKGISQRSLPRMMGHFMSCVSTLRETRGHMKVLSALKPLIQGNAETNMGDFIRPYRLTRGRSEERRVGKEGRGREER